ncbi:hypothetical protein D3C80_1700240 [compost metagenome]
MQQADRGDAGQLGDITHGGRAIAILGEHQRCRIQQRSAAHFALGRAAALGCRRVSCFGVVLF